MSIKSLNKIDQVTIKDVAKHAGVGVGTVSRVLNESDNVRQGTRDKVLESIKILDYTPNPIARRLSLGKTLTIAVVVPFLTSEVSPVERLRGVEHALAGSKYDLLLINSESPEERDEAFRNLPARAVDGVLLITVPLSDEDAARFRKAQIATVMVDGVTDVFSKVMIDDVQGGYQATKHLIDLGHTNIALITSEIDSSFGFKSGRFRYKGYMRALEEAGIPVNPNYQIDLPHGPSPAKAATLDLLQIDNPPTAVFAASDTQAMGVLNAAQTLGISVPEELSVIGFDDIEFAEFLNLTTIRQSLFESGVRGGELLLEAMQQLDAPLKTIKLPTELVVRGTTAPPIAQR